MMWERREPPSGLHAPSPPSVWRSEPLSAARGETWLSARVAASVGAGERYPPAAASCSLLTRPCHLSFLFVNLAMPLASKSRRL